MCNVIKVINLIKLPPNDPLPGSYNFLNHKMTKKYFFHKNNGVRIVQCALTGFKRQPNIRNHLIRAKYAIPTIKVPLFRKYKSIEFHFNFRKS